MAFVNDHEVYLENESRRIDLDLKAFTKFYVEKKYGGDLN